MERRNFIKRTTALTALSLIPAPFLFADTRSTEKGQALKILPKRLKKGDIIGLIAPAGVITEKQLKNTIENVEKLGYKTYHTDSVLSKYGYFAGKDKERADDLMHMFTNKDIAGILCIRGGYGAIRILDMLDYDSIKQNPKVFIGYSDITAFLSSIYENTGLITFHGPVGISSFNEFTVNSYKNIIETPQNKYKYQYLREKNTEETSEFDVYTINEGKAEGELTGGNLSVIISMIGTKFEPNFENKIVFLEEIDEKTYKVDRMLTQLVQATNIKEASGIVLGIFKKCDQDEEPKLSLKEAITDILKPLDIPVSYGMAFGHVANKITIPVGIKAKMNAGKNSLKLLEEAVL